MNSIADFSGMKVFRIFPDFFHIFQIKLAYLNALVKSFFFDFSIPFIPNALNVFFLRQFQNANG